ILFEMVTDRLPFQAELIFDVMAMHVREAPPDVRDTSPEVPAPLAELVRRMLAKGPSERPTMQQVAAELQRMGPATPSMSSSPGLPSALSPTPEAMERLSRQPTVLLQQEAPAPTLRTERAPRRVLVVDDEPDIALTLRSLLEMEGYACMTLHRGDEVMATLAEFHPDIVLLDVELPGKSGYKLCWEIKS